VHPFNPSIWEVEARGLRVQGQPGLHSETLSQATLPSPPKKGRRGGGRGGRERKRERLRVELHQNV
jgi:hypothetical protein